ncbi:8007_t:CDS:2 [Funneliformis geosporum]|uniref:7252_t:CDS:1 n=1 Tax=Funneliformis geosporum TaxID=1117311 RepID=A0A9W4SJJ9_9GLOM|nr:8007_t:CDS:2 [Funneliformis geosporum]CAI2170784.1 7252_t:CDS:2 [Funneliformis geosporum]
MPFLQGLISRLRNLQGRNIRQNNFERNNENSFSRDSKRVQEVRSWSVQEVNEFLQTTLGEKWTPRETKIFEKNKITGSIFLNLTIKKMKSLKVPLTLAFEIDKLQKELRQKRIMVQQYDDDGHSSLGFDFLTIDCQENFEMVLRRSNAMGLELIKSHFNEDIYYNTPILISSFDELIDEQEYRYDAIHRFSKKWR